MLTALLVMSVLALLLGAVLGFSAIKFRVEGNPLVDKIDAILPQTQCGQCSYPGCKPYATAIAAGEADINRCPPGGEEGIQKLAELLGRDFVPFGEDAAAPKPKSVAVIDENTCIGCTLCIQACPVDAISGAAKQMHTIIEAECTGCELCIPPCPVECITMVVIQENIMTWKFHYPTSQYASTWNVSSIPAIPAMSKADR
jgi:electron transport complex protein RnfB